MKNKTELATHNAINRHAEELESLRAETKNALAKADWSNKRIEKFSNRWDGFIKFLGTIITLGMIILWIGLTHNWYYSSTYCSLMEGLSCLNYEAVFFGAFVSIIILIIGLCLTWWIANKLSIRHWKLHLEVEHYQ